LVSDLLPLPRLTLPDSLREEVVRSDARFQSLNEELLSLNEQVKRLKSLLGKSRDLLQEREEEAANKMKEAVTPWRVCQVECCVEGGAFFDKCSAEPKWYLLSTDLVEPDDGGFSPHIHHFPQLHKSYRWVPETELVAWIDCQLSTVTPSSSYQLIASSFDITPPTSEICSWLSLEKFSRLAQESSLSRSDALRSENRRLSSELESLTQQFHTYKLRAQSALKRIGKDEQMERYKQMEEEDNLWNELKSKVQLLEVAVEAKDAEITKLLAQADELRRLLKDQSNQLLECQERLRAQDLRSGDGKLELKRVEEKNRLLEEMIERLQDERNELSERLKELSVGRVVAAKQFLGEEKSSPVGEIGDEADSDYEDQPPARPSRPTQVVPLFSPPPGEESDEHQVYLAHIQVTPPLLTSLIVFTLRRLQPSRKQ
jgi:hypothetical protein